MTDVATLRELNEEIALASGWRRQDAPGGLGGIWYPPPGHASAILVHAPDYPPPFSSEWALAGPLLEEMGEDRATLETVDLGGIDDEDDLPGWECSWQRSPGIFDAGSASSPCEAIARAWLAHAKMRNAHR